MGRIEEENKIIEKVKDVITIDMVDNSATSISFHINIVLYEFITTYPVFIIKTGYSNGVYKEFRFILGNDTLISDVFDDIPMHAVCDVSEDFVNMIYDGIVGIYMNPKFTRDKKKFPLPILAKLPNRCINLMNDNGYLDKYSMNDRIWLYDNSKNGSFLKKEVLDIFMF